MRMLSAEELEAAFKNKFEQQDPEPETNTSKKYSIEINGKTHNFEVSLDEVIYALETVINDTYSEADNAYYGVKVYEKYVVMVDYWTGKAYKQSYKKKNWFVFFKRRSCRGVSKISDTRRRKCIR